jgi:hypothetical protein
VASPPPTCGPSSIVTGYVTASELGMSTGPVTTSRLWGRHGLVVFTDGQDQDPGSRVPHTLKHR